MNWDTYFINIAREVAKKSHCLSIQRGCVLVRDRQILSTGYSGPPAGYPHCEWRDDEGYYRLDLEPISVCPRQRMGFKSGEGLEFCPSVHAEGNAILQAARNGVSTKGATLYCNFASSPCRECAKAIVNAGIVEVVVTEKANVGYDVNGIRGIDILESCHILLRNAEVSIEKE